jgi:hypothetical protein
LSLQHIAAYIGELIGQMPGVMHLVPFLDPEQIMHHASFYSAVLGRAAQLEGIDFSPTHYHRFDYLVGGNQVDDFLIRIGFLDEKELKE